MGLGLSSGELAGRNPLVSQCCLLHPGVSRGGPPFAFGQRHLFWRVPVLRLLLSFAELGCVQDERRKGQRCRDPSRKIRESGETGRAGAIASNDKTRSQPAAKR